MKSILSVLILVPSALFAGLIQWNPLLFGKSSGALPSVADFFVFHENDVLDEVLFRHVNQLGEHFDAYRNHCLRVISLAVHHQGGLRKTSKKEADMISMAVAHSKLALWDNEQNNLLEAAVQLLNDEIPRKSKFHRHEFDETDRTTMRDMVRRQHKLWMPSDSSNPNIINSVRKAIWTDLTMGLVRFDGLPIEYVEQALLEQPYLDLLSKLIDSWSMKRVKLLVSMIRL